MQKLVFAKHNNNTISAQKVRLVVDLIRGKKALEAVDILLFTKKYAAKDVLKVLNSAIANAVHNENMDKKDLVVAQVMVDNATTYKRGKAVARGRYHQIFRRNCHITIAVTDGSDVAPVTAAKSTTPAPEKKSEKVEVKAAKPAVKKAAKTNSNSKSK